MKLLSQAFAVLVIAAMAPNASADKKVQKKDCPAAVQKTIDEESKGATVKGIATEVEDGKTYYELETTSNGHSRDVLVDVDGRVVSVEEEIPVASLPPAAKAALEGRGKILSAESVTKGGVVTYEAKVDSHGKKSEIAVTADGVIKK